MKKSFYFLSSNMETKLHVCLWMPEGRPRAVVQIMHGMLEHIDRYDEFARFLCDNNIAVIGNDMLGHGASVNSEEDRGYFSDTNGKTYLLNDMHKVTVYARKLFYGIPVFLLGHSMGSFLLRSYITKWGNDIDGCILVGTGNVKAPAARFGKFISWSIVNMKGTRYRSRFLSFCVIGFKRLAFKLSGRGSWLSKNTENVREYENDPQISFTFTASANHTLFSLLEDLADGKDFDDIPKALPVLLASGTQDPVGNNTKGVLAVYNRFVKLGMRDAEILLYPGDRHEILNETDRDVVYRDILYWLNERI